jgi:hypothetical protein
MPRTEVKVNVKFCERIDEVLNGRLTASKVQHYHYLGIYFRATELSYCAGRV